MSMVTILNCRKGHQPDLLPRYSDDTGSKFTGYMVACYKCGVVSEVQPTKRDAIGLWNDDAARFWNRAVQFEPNGFGARFRRRTGARKLEV